METYDAHKTTTEVRQGSRRMMNFRVLVVSFAAVVVAFALIYAVFFLQPHPVAI
jgi:hypothetical protein